MARSRLKPRSALFRFLEIYCPDPEKLVTPMDELAIGVAKDLTKTASKSAIKAVSKDGSKELFNLVAWFTGSKNAMKGIGFFLGGLLLETVGFRMALWLMAGLLAVILVAGLLLLPRELGKAKGSRTVRELFAKSRGVNLLAAARVFLFGARDVWFVVGLPVFLYAEACMREERRKLGNIRFLKRDAAGLAGDVQCAGPTSCRVRFRGRPVSAEARSPARPWTNTPRPTASSVRRPWAISPPISPVSTSPVPPVAMPGLPVGLT